LKVKVPRILLPGALWKGKSPGRQLKVKVPRILLPGSGGGRWNLILLPGSAQPCSLG
jgi:hypothetical protein